MPLPATLRTADLLAGWQPRRVGSQIEILAECGSTNELAFDRAAAGASDGLCIFADVQTAGRGRHGRTWLAPRGAGILLSVLLIETRHAAEDPVGPLTLLTAVAACEAIRETTELTAAIKWPNDLRINRRKLAGILIESRPLRGDRRAIVVGIGLNCLQQAGHFPPELRDIVTSLEIESSHPVDRAAVARALLQRLDGWLAETADLNAVHARWLEFAEPLGQRVRLQNQGVEYSGHILSVDPLGGLVVQCDHGGQAWFDPMRTRLL